MRLLGITVLLAVAASACTGSPTPVPGTPNPTGTVSVYPRCLSKAPPEGTLSVTGRPGKPEPLVAGTPQTVTVCRYARLPSQRLVRSANLTAAQARSLRRMLDALRPVSPGTPFSCPIDRGDIDLVLVRYGPAKTVPIKVSLSGCRQATNRFGRTFATTAALRTALRRLVGGPPSS